MATIESALRYPIGPFEASPAADRRQQSIADVAALPQRLSDAIEGLNDRQLDTPYRPDGWTVRQVVHHIADSHMNALIRLKLALTQEQPRVSAYDENAFATLPDVRLPVDVSLELVRSLHARWVAVYAGMTEDQWSHTFIHPEYPEPQSLDRQVQLYGWHSRHHVAHIASLRQRERW